MQLTPTKLAAFYKTVGGDYDCRWHRVPLEFATSALANPDNLVQPFS